MVAPGDRTGSADGDAPFRAVFECALDAMLITDDTARYVDANPAALALLGLTREEILGKRVHDFASVPPELVDRSWAAFLHEGRQEGVYELRRKDGATIVVEFRAVANTTPGRHLSIMRDRTAVHRMEESRTRIAEMEKRLAVADRMASIGTLAAGVAHEINNPLAAIIANLDYIGRELPRVAKESGLPHALHALLEPIDEARTSAERIHDVVRDLKLFSRPHDQRGPIDPKRILESSLQLARNDIRHRARVVKDYRTSPIVWGNDGRIGQVFLNLLVNAAQAIPEGDADHNEIRVVVDTHEGGGALVEIHDSGIGIAADDLPRVFEPFFTTKAIGLGTGLGLSICLRIVQEMGGDLSVESTPGEGSTFRVRFPVAPAAAVTNVTPAREEAARDVKPKSGRILVIDDEPLVLKALVRSLGGLHDVTTVITAQAALDRIERGEHFDVIVCDLMMPQMNGMDLYGELRNLSPRQAERMIFMTGGAFTPRARRFLEGLPNARIEKPFDATALLALIDERVRRS